MSQKCHGCGVVFSERAIAKLRACNAQCCPGGPYVSALHVPGPQESVARVEAEEHLLRLRTLPQTCSGAARGAPATAQGSTLDHWEVVVAEVEARCGLIMRRSEEQRAQLAANAAVIDQQNADLAALRARVAELEARATAAEERAKALTGYVRHGFREDGTPCESYGFPTPPPGKRCTCGLAALTGQEESRG